MPEDKQKPVENSEDEKVLVSFEEVEKKQKEYEDKLKKKDETISKLSEAILNRGTPAPAPAAAEKPKSSKELKKDYVEAINKREPNVEIMRKSLAQRKAAIREGKRDPYLPTKVNDNPTAERMDQENAEAVAEAFEGLVKIYDEQGESAFAVAYQEAFRNSR